MGSFRNFIPLTLAVGFGILNGYYAFNPAFKEYNNKDLQPSIAKDEQQQDKLSDTTQQR
ncbi:hypothetical protein F5B20DRAFT_555468 [Whalleya microplaca]|nr:hypothetical protein F5B20DRAFT_555468 [Whalleya microplaca]